MLVYPTTNSFIALGKLVELKLEVCTKKNKFRSLKNYAVDTYKNALKKINFPNYEYFEDANWAHSDFFHKLMTVIGNVAPRKNKRIKRNTQNWFDVEVLEKRRSRHKLFLKRSGKRGFILIKNYIKRLSTTQKS